MISWGSPIQTCHATQRHMENTQARWPTILVNKKYPTIWISAEAKMLWNWTILRFPLQCQERFWTHPGWANGEVRQSLLDSGIVAYSTVTIKKDRRILVALSWWAAKQIGQSVRAFPGLQWSHVENIVKHFRTILQLPIMSHHVGGFPLFVFQRNSRLFDLISDEITHITRIVRPIPCHK